MNALTVNLHLLLASFYRPSGERTALLIEQHAFPSDRYAAESQVRFHGLDPARDLIEIAPREGEACMHVDDIIATLEREGPRIATVLLPGVQYLTGQALDIATITAAAHRAGCTVGFDLAHAIGNVALDIHGADVDFAAWCSYKYLNGGPGCVGGASCTSVTPGAPTCLASQDGGGTTRRRASRWVPSSTRSRAPKAGR